MLLFCFTLKLLTECPKILQNLFHTVANMYGTNINFFKLLGQPQNSLCLYSVCVCMQGQTLKTTLILRIYDDITIKL